MKRQLIAGVFAAFLAGCGAGGGDSANVAASSDKADETSLKKNDKCKNKAHKWKPLCQAPTLTLDFENLTGGFQNGIFIDYALAVEDGFQIVGAGGMAALDPADTTPAGFGYVMPTSKTLFGANSPKILTALDGMTFSAVSIDLDQLRTSFQYGTGPMTFVGVKENNTLVQIDFSIDMTVGMQTFLFGTDFEDIKELRIPDQLIVQFDNIVLAP